MPSIGLPELILVFIVALLVVGPKRLPDLGRQVGRAMREFRSATSGIRDELGVDDIVRDVSEIKSTLSFDDVKQDMDEIRSSLTVDAGVSAGGGDQKPSDVEESS